MQERWYVALPLSWLEDTAELSDAEKGRLTDAIVTYVRDGEGWQKRLQGNERYLFPMFRTRMDRALAEIQAKLEAKRENGRKGGLVKRQKSQGKQDQDSLSECSHININPNPSLNPSPNGLYSEDDEDNDNSIQEGACARVRVESAWKKCFGEKPNPEVARTLARWVTFYNYDDVEMIDELVSTVAVNNARNPVGYAVEVLRDWRRRGVLGLEDLE